MKAIFIAVFIVATFVASIVFSFLDRGQRQVNFFARFLDFALHYGWVVGVVVTAIFWFFHRGGPVRFEKG